MRAYSTHTLLAETNHTVNRLIFMTFGQQFSFVEPDVNHVYITDYADRKGLVQIL